MRLLLAFFALCALTIPTLTASAQPRATLQAASFGDGTDGSPSPFMGTAWSYVAGTASSMSRFVSEGLELVAVAGTVRDHVALTRPVLPGALPASTHGVSHLVFDAQGEGTVFVALEVGDRTEPFLYRVPLHPGAETFRVPLDQLRQRGTGAPFAGGPVVRVSFYVTARPGTAEPFALRVGRLAFEQKTPLAARY